MSISRVGYGYQVRVMRKGQIYSRFFKRKRDAQEYEKDLKRVLGPRASQKGWVRGPRKTTTGIPRIVERKFQRKGRSPVDVFMVYWRTPEGQPRYSTVSISHHGREKAFRIAKRIKREKDAAWLGDTKRKAAAPRKAAAKSVKSKSADKPASRRKGNRSAKRRRRR